MLYRGRRDFESKILEAWGKVLWILVPISLLCLSRCEALGIIMSRRSLGPDLPVKLDPHHSSMAV